MELKQFARAALASVAIAFSGITVAEEPVVIGLSVDEAADLAYMREEEKLARDVYLTLGEMWGGRVFDNIAESEQRHTDAIKALLDTYGLVDPALDAVGYFANEDLQAMYDTLISRGMASELEALHVGALIEEVDITDIQHAIEAADHEDIERVYENLMQGSRNHLRAFVDAIERRGVEYEAQHLDEDEVEEIVESPVETGSAIDD